VIWGTEIGATVEGSVDFARDYVNLKGTFVPAYALNNMFPNIPLIGPLLGGGTNEGLFAVNYRVSGAASAPVVSVNLLSAIAPGFLRQIFGAIENPNPMPNAAPTQYAPATQPSQYAPTTQPFDFPSSER
jgi:AsmA-like C-terminal region